MNMFKYTLEIIVLSVLLIATSCNTDAQKGSSESQDSHNHTPAVAVEKETSGMAEITFESLEFDFGTINEGETVSHTFRFTNTGSAPLVIQSATPSCGCTVPDAPKGPIAPGESGHIQVTFDSKNKRDTQNRTVTIVANTQPSMTYLRIRGMVNSSDPQAAGPFRN